MTNYADNVAPDQRLAKGAVSIRDAIAISISVLAPGMAMFLNVAGVAGTAGGSTPLAFLLGGIACLALAFVVIGFAGSVFYAFGDILLLFFLAWLVPKDAIRRDDRGPNTELTCPQEVGPSHSRARIR